MYPVVIHRRAVRYLKKLPQDQQARIKHVLNEMSNDPFRLSNVKNMVGDWAGYQRMRVGSTRIIFWVDKDKKIIYVDHVGPRGDVYKGGT